jgi:glutamate/tyrosine decarboxylase-like PLP-dependent enzyme
MRERDLGPLQRALERLEGSFAALPPFAPPLVTEDGARVLLEVADRLAGDLPYYHPLYAGQMLKPPHPVARLAYALATWVNPNNHALDGGRATSAMEKEAVAELARLFGWHTHLGHLCGGGTMANLEALWVAGRLRPNTTILASDQAHYTHRRISGVLGLPFEAIATDRGGRMDVAALERRLAAGGVGTVVATLGTTATGAVDPLPQLLALRERFDIHLHADAAYGGYFRLVRDLESATRAAFRGLVEVDSLVVDPHKHGLQPYGCGCVLFRDPAVGRLYKHDSPYTYFTSTDLHLGEISLECSRPGASAAALWATQRLLPLVEDGDLARALGASRAAALALDARLRADRRFVTAGAPQLDIVVFAPRAPSVTAVSARSRRVFAEAARLGLHLALATLPAAFFDLEAAQVTRDAEVVDCLRSVLMKPEHLDWIDAIWTLLDRAVEAAPLAEENP